MPAKRPVSAAPRLGLTKTTFGYGHLLETVPGAAISNPVQGRSDAKRKPSPAIDAPPESSSDDASLVDDEELVDITSPPKAKRRKGPTIRAPRNVNGATSSDTTSAAATSSQMEKSRIPHTTFASLRKKSTRGYGSGGNLKTVNGDSNIGIKDDFDDPFSVFQSSPKVKRFQSTYTKSSNVHGSAAAQREKKPSKKSAAVVKEGAGGFKRADQAILDSIRMYTRLLVFDTELIQV